MEELVVIDFIVLLFLVILVFIISAVVIDNKKEKIIHIPPNDDWDVSSIDNHGYMTVGGLIKFLAKYDLDARVIVYDHGDGQYLDAVYGAKLNDWSDKYKGVVGIIAEN